MDVSGGLPIEAREGAVLGQRKGSSRSPARPLSFLPALLCPGGRRLLQNLVVSRGLVAGHLQENDRGSHQHPQGGAEEHAPGGRLPRREGHQRYRLFGEGRRKPGGREGWGHLGRGSLSHPPPGSPKLCPAPWSPASRFQPTRGRKAAG